MRMLVLLALLAGTVAAAQPGGAPVRLAVPGRVNATPSIAALGGFVAVAWGATLPESGADVFLGVSRDGGRTFDPPVRVNQRIGEARLGGELPPRVALVRRAAGDPGIVVAWGAAAGRTTIRVARSTDGGRTFALESALPPTAVAGDRGWHALTMDASGTAHLVWLDHRGLAARPKATEHDHHGDGAGMSQWSTLSYAAVGTDGATRGARDLLPGVCYCCKTALATGPSGQLVAAWRHVYSGNIRDIAFAQSLDGVRRAAVVTASRSKAGMTFGSPRRIATGSSAYPVLALGADGVVGAWTDGVGEQSAIVIQVAVAKSSLGSQAMIRQAERPY